MKRLLIILIFSHFCSFAFTQIPKLSLHENFDDLEKKLIFHEDTVYVINFWATWCEPCVRELPYFEAFHLKHIHQPFKVILLSLDFKKQIDSHLIPFLNKNNITSTIWLLTDTKYNKWMNKINEEWSGSIPATWLVSGGQHHFIEKDFHSLEALETYIFNSIQ